MGKRKAERRHEKKATIFSGISIVLAKKNRDKCGCDGEPVELREAKDLSWAEGKREVKDANFNNNCDRIAWLFAHRIIEQRQYDAAERLMQDWYLAQISSGASTLSAGSGGKRDVFPNDIKVDAMRRHGDARKALGYNWPIVEMVVQQNLSVEKAAGALHVDRRFATGMLFAALQVLADHYNLT